MYFHTLIKNLDIVPPQILADRLSQFMHYFTLYGSVRPFGSAILLAGYDADKEQPWLNLIEPSGLSFVRNKYIQKNHKIYK